MYSSLDKIDLVAERKDGRVLAFQTDHREAHEIEAEPEISVLFALTRVIGPRQAMQAQGKPLDGIVYRAQHVPPALLVEALASAGALLQAGDDATERTLPAAGVTPEVLADRAFTALAARVSRRCGLTDPATVLRALEAETLAERPDRDADEAGYWTRVLELVAVVAAVLRTRHPVRWILTDYTQVPFALSVRTDEGVLVVNRAMRFLDDGEDESMFLIVRSLDEIVATAAGEATGPLMPSLRWRSEAEDLGMLWRPLVDAESDAAPVIAYGHDLENSFRLLLRASGRDADQLHTEAIANLGRRDIEVELDEVVAGELRMLAVSGDFYATEKLLDPAFMLDMAAQCEADVLAVGVPRRGLMFIAPFDDRAQLAVIAELIAGEHAAAGSRSISPSVLIVTQGEVVGLAQIAEHAEPEPPKPQGFFRRLFRRS